MENFFGSIADYFSNNIAQLVGCIFITIVAILTMVLPRHIMVKFTNPKKVTRARAAGGIFIVLEIVFLVAVGVGYVNRSLIRY